MDMKISIITVNFNNRNGLYKTIASVHEQQLKNFEHFIVDAFSSDLGEPDWSFIKDNDISFISEKDHGIYDGMNKGAALTKNDYLFFLNSGDALHGNSVFQLVQPFLCNYDLIYGNIILEENDNKILYSYPKNLTIEYMIVYGLPHQGTFISRNLHNSVGGYTTSYKIISDWVFFMESLFINKATYIHIDSVFSVFDGHGISQKDENIKLIIQEQMDYLFTRFPSYIDFYKNNSPQVKKYFRRMPRWKRFFKQFLFFKMNKLF